MNCSCGKVSYDSRREARREGRRLASVDTHKLGVRWTAYRCPNGERYHLGHERMEVKEMIREHTREEVA